MKGRNAIMAHKVKIFFDYVCPYCFIAKGMVDELRKNHELEVEWIPFELNEAAPEEGMKLSEHFPDMDLAEQYRAFNTTIKPYGLEFSGTDLLTNTRKAHLASEYARDQGRALEFHAEVSKAFFTDGKNIGSPEVLKKIAEKVGLDADEMMDAVEGGRYDDRLNEAKTAAEKHQIEVVPTYFINGSIRIDGAQPIERFKAALAKEEDQIG